MYGDREPEMRELLEGLIAELDDAGQHTDVSIEDETGRCFSASTSGLVTRENAELDAALDRLDRQS